MCEYRLLPLPGKATYILSQWHRIHKHLWCVRLQRFKEDERQRVVKINQPRLALVLECWFDVSLGDMVAKSLRLCTCPQKVVSSKCHKGSG